MAFSIRSFFGKEKGSDPLNPGSPTHQGSALPPLGANPFQPAPNHPFAAGAAHQAADPASAPMNSPFTPFTPADSGRTDLTVGDILPGLPLEALNSRQVALNQPLHLADEVIDRALSSGQAAIPLFEIYRVCPALFPSPVSPEDKRLVPIPPHKIASLLPKSGAPAAPSPAPGTSPFAIAPAGSAPGFGGGPASNSIFSPFVQADPPGGETESPTTLFHPSPFGFGSPSPEAKPEPPQPAAAASPFSLLGGTPDASQSAPLAPGMPNPFAPTSAASFSSMAFGMPGSTPASNAPATPSPFSFGTPNLPPAAPQTAAPASEPAPLPSPFASALPEPARPMPTPFDFASPTKPGPASAGEASPFAAASPTPAAAPAPAPAPQQSSSLWAGGSPFAAHPNPNPGTATQSVPLAPGVLQPSLPAESAPAPKPVAAPVNPFSSPFAEAASSLPPQAPATPSARPGGPNGPTWMPTPAKPGMGASPFAGFAVPPPAQPTPIEPEQGSPAATVTPSSAPVDPYAPSVENAPSQPTAGMPAFPGFPPAAPEAPIQKQPGSHPFLAGPAPTVPGAPAEQALPPLQPGPFTPAPEVARPQQPAANLNPFERIQALSRNEAGPTGVVPTAPAEPRMKEPAPAQIFEAPSEPAQPIVPAAQLPPAAAAAPAPEPEKVVPPTTATTSIPVLGPNSSSVFAPAPELRPLPHAGPGSVSAEKVSLSLASVLKSCKTHEIGMSPDHIPSWVRVNLPLDLIRPQLLSGKVTLRVTQVMAALEPELRNLITPSRPDLSVDLPMGELRKALPNEPFPEPSAATPQSDAPPAVPIFQLHRFSPASTPTSSAAAPDLVFGTPTTPPPVPPFFQTAAQEETPLSAFSSSLADSTWPLSPGTPEPEPAPAVESPELTSAFSFLKEEPELLGPEEAEDAVIDITPAAPAAVEAPAPVPQAVVPAPVSTPARPAATSGSGSPGITKSAIRVIHPTPASQSASQMLLRALLNTDEPLDTASVVQLLSCQPGIVAVSCLRDGTCLASAGNGSAEAEHFLNQAPKLHHHVQPLMVLTGSLDTETFSMNSGAFVITFSLQTELTLGVLHDPRTQGPALRERITLIARELTPLLNLPAA